MRAAQSSRPRWDFRRAAGRHSRFLQAVWERAQQAPLPPGGEWGVSCPGLRGRRDAGLGLLPRSLTLLPQPLTLLPESLTLLPQELTLLPRSLTLQHQELTLQRQERAEHTYRTSHIALRPNHADNAADPAMASPENPLRPDSSGHLPRPISTRGRELRH